MVRVDLAGKLSDARTRVAAETPPGQPSAPMFARLARKDARIRDDQVTALAALADAVMRRRRFKAERITENTLIRVAIDLLLAHADRLRGSTEDELRNSVTSAVPKSVAPGVPDFATPGLSSFPPPAAMDSAPLAGAARGPAMISAGAASETLARDVRALAKPGTSHVRDSGSPQSRSLTGSGGSA
ncbi:MAG: hypothetical protein ACTHNQ_15640 [Microbacterium sp.]|uniref:hypothetical protein n=1 Tax=Microbacterium sp. TaxID=51671 RepID=UPI003F809AF7